MPSFSCLTLYFKKKVYIYLWLCWVFIALHRLSLVAESRACSLLAVRGPLIVVASLVAEHGSRACGFSSCYVRDQ